MNRKIKFRGKRKDNGEWVYGYYIVAGGMAFISTFGIREPVEVIPETVGQFTGLHDCNGDEIYEGDIMAIKDRMENTTLNCKVQFESGSFSAVPLENGDLAYIMYYASKNGEIIGNIHDEEEK